MTATIAAALGRGLAIGAHPGYADRDHFGRRALAIPPEAVAASVEEQVARLLEVAARLGARITHVKPHGALYNQAVRDAALAEAIARGTGRALGGDASRVVLVGLAGSPCLEVWRRAGFRAAAEGFADRRYEADGTLRARTLPGALLDEAGAAAEQAVRMARDGEATAIDGRRVAIAAETLCIHGDTPGAPAIAAAVAARLKAAGVLVASLPTPPGAA